MGVTQKTCWYNPENAPNAGAATSFFYLRPAKPVKSRPRSPKSEPKHKKADPPPGAACSALIVSQNLKVCCFLADAAQGIFHCGIIQVAFEVYEEVIFPLFVRDRSGFDLIHVEIVVNKVG